MSGTPNRIVVVNTSPLIYLYCTDNLLLLQKLYGKIVIPSAVRDELLEGLKLRANIPDPSHYEWIEVRTLRSLALLPAVIDLGRGEAEVIALAREETDCLVIIDDRLGRKIAEVSGLTVTGSLGILLRAKESGLISAVGPILLEMRSRGFWINDELLNLVLQKAGEPY